MTSTSANTNPAPGTMTGRAAFMQHIAERLGRTAPLQEAPVRDVRGVPEHYAAIALNQQEKLALFEQNWTALTGTVWTVPEQEAATAIPALAAQLCADKGITRVARWEHPSLAALPLDEALQQNHIDVVPWQETNAGHEQPDARKHRPLLYDVEQTGLGIVWADYAVAHTGTVVLLAREGRGRSVSLMPHTLLAIFRADQLVTRMGEAFQLIREQHPNAAAMPSSINFITGPSRSADIENDLTIGIHGPGSVYAILIV